MKILIIRHGDPDYSIDSLTEKGWKEAEYLAEKLCKLDIKDMYVSPLGRAKDTASCTLKRLNRTAMECEWLREFNPTIIRPDRPEERSGVTWDWLPQDWTADERFYEYNHWYESPVMQEGKVKEEYDRVTGHFDALLAEHGYERSGHIYKAVKSNNDTLVFFCHFGSGAVLVSHLLSMSPMVVWHNFCAAPSSVITLTTEERRPGIANFRMSAYGDISHLYANEEPPAFAARFRECFTNEWERLD